MSEPGDIQAQIEAQRTLNAQQQAEAAATAAQQAAVLTSEQQAQEALRRANTAENLALCARFIDWANDNNIPQNSPSPLFRGWLLGKRVLWTQHGNYREVTWETNHHASILASPRGTIREMALSKEVLRGNGIGKPKLPRLAKAPLGEYDPTTIKGSIVEFAVKYGVDWE